MQDKSDEIIDLNCSLLVGVANEICQKQELKRSKEGVIAGILDSKQSQQLIDSIQYLLNVDYDLSQALEETMEREKQAIEYKLKGVCEVKKQIKMQNEMLDELKVVLIETH